MEARIKRWGNSLGLRIPRAMAEDLGLKEDSVVELQNEAGQLVIHPKRKSYKLDELLAQVSSHNLHPETDWGPAIGKEEW